MSAAEWVAFAGTWIGLGFGGIALAMCLLIAGIASLRMWQEVKGAYLTGYREARAATTAQPVRQFDSSGEPTEPPASAEQDDGYLLDALVLVLSDTPPPDKVTASMHKTRSLIWVETPQAGHCEAIYDYDYAHKSFIEVGDSRYGSVSQVLTNHEDTLVRIQTLTLPGAVEMADEVSDLAAKDRKLHKLPAHLRAYIEAMSPKEREAFASFTGIDREEAIKDGMAVTARAPRKVDIS